MPQPLSHYGAEFNVHAWGSEAIKARPALSAKAMELIAIWAFTDSQLTRILANFLGGLMEVATVMLQDLGPDARQRTIITTAKAVMPADLALLVQASLNSTKASRDRRNDFAHHLWGICDQVPDALILSDPRETNKQGSIITGQVVRAQGQGQIAIPTYKGGVPWDNSKWFVYKDADFDIAIKDALRAQDIANKLFSLTFPVTLPDKRDSIRRELEADPLIQQKIQTLSRKN